MLRISIVIVLIFHIGRHHSMPFPRRPVPDRGSSNDLATTPGPHPPLTCKDVFTKVLQRQTHLDDRDLRLLTRCGEIACRSTKTNIQSIIEDYYATPFTPGLLERTEYLIERELESAINGWICKGQAALSVSWFG